MKNKNFKNKIIIITGSNGVLGSCLAKALKNSVKKLILIDKDDKNKNRFGTYYQCNFIINSELQNFYSKIDLLNHYF